MAQRSKHWGFLAGSFWEIIRFSLVIVAALTLLVPIREPVTPLIIIWTSSISLAIASAYIALGLYPAKYGAYLHILRIAKFFSLIPGIAVFFLLVRRQGEIPAVSDYTYAMLKSAGMYGAEENRYQFLRLSLIVIVLVVDIIFLLFLLLWGREKRIPGKPLPPTPLPPTEHLPKVEDVRVEEE